MAQPEYQSSEPGSETTASTEPGVMIRGADGALYILTEKNLAPFRVPEDKAREINEILRRAPTETVSYDLHSDVMHTVREVAKCVGAHVQITLRKP